MGTLQFVLSMGTQTKIGATNALYNVSEFFHNINVPTNIFSQGYIDMELECLSSTASIDFFSEVSEPLNTFFNNLIVVD